MCVMHAGRRISDADQCKAQKEASYLSQHSQRSARAYIRLLQPEQIELDPAMFTLSSSSKFQKPHTYEVWDTYINKSLDGTL